MIPRVQAAGAIPVSQEPKGQVAPMIVKITPTTLEQYGYTAGCRRCTLLRAGRTAMGVKHTEPCRDCIEGRLRAAGDESMARADARVDEHLAGRVQDAERGSLGVSVGAGANPVAAAPVSSSVNGGGRAV